MNRRPYLLTTTICFFLLVSSIAYSPSRIVLARIMDPNRPDYLPGWAWYLPVTITNSTTAPLTDYQVQIHLNAGNFVFGNARSDGGDLRFTDADQTTLLSYWIESYNAAAQTARIWVKVPSIPLGSKTIWLVYGNPGATTISSGTNTFDFFDDFEPGSTVQEGYYSLGSAQTIMTQSGWETEAPHTLSVVEAPSGAGVNYYGYYGLVGESVCGAIGRATSDDLVTWTKDTTCLFCSNGERWPSVVKSGSTYYMVHTRNYCGDSEIGWRTSSDGVTWTSYTQLVPPVSGRRNQNPNLFHNPNDGEYYLYWYSSNLGEWNIMARHATTVADLASASDILVLHSDATLAAPNMMYRDGTYFLSAETHSGAWNVVVYSSSNPTSGFTLLPGNPVLVDGSACMFQTPIGNTLYAYYCKLTGSTWTLDLRTADLTAPRPQFHSLDWSNWTADGGSWDVVSSVTQQDGSTGYIAQGITSARQILYSTNFSGSDYIFEGYGQQRAGRVWGLGARATNNANLYSINLYEDLDATNNLYLYRWLNGGVITVQNAALGAINLNTWHKLTVKVHGSSIDVYYNDSSTPAIQGTNSQFGSGRIALYGESGTTAWFNDVRVRKYANPEPTVSLGSPTAVNVSSFTGVPHLGAVQLDWETASEVGLVGFNLYRSDKLDGVKEKLNVDLIPAQHPDQLLGARYQLSDAVEQGRRYYYWLELVKHQGTELLNPVEVDTDYLVRLPLINR